MECRDWGSRIETPPHTFKRKRPEKNGSGRHTRALPWPRTYTLPRAINDVDSERHRMRHVIGSVSLASPVSRLPQATVDMFRSIYFYSGLEMEGWSSGHMRSTRLLIQSVFSLSPQPQRVEFGLCSLADTIAGNERQLHREWEKIIRSFMRTIATAVHFKRLLRRCLKCARKPPSLLIDK